MAFSSSISSCVIRCIINWLLRFCAKPKYTNYQSWSNFNNSHAASSFIGVMFGWILPDKWVQKNAKSSIYTSVIGLGLTIPALLLMGFGHTFYTVAGAAICFGLGYGIFDAKNMRMLCQFITSRYRGTAYEIMNITGVFAGALITDLLDKSSDAGNLGKDSLRWRVLYY